MYIKETMQGIAVCRSLERRYPALCKGYENARPLPNVWKRRRPCPDF